jgi:hypothetical protein
MSQVRYEVQTFRYHWYASEIMALPEDRHPQERFEALLAEGWEPMGAMKNGMDNVALIWLRRALAAPTNAPDDAYQRGVREGMSRMANVVESVMCDTYNQERT